MRRALLVWGLGHLALGDRRGLILLVLQPLAVIAILVVAVQLIEGSRWLVVFPPLAALIVVWIGQAVHAYKRAVQVGATPGGEVQVALLIPLAAAAMTVYWLIGGRHGSPSATLEEYVTAWMSNRAAAAVSLFGTPPPADELVSRWAAAQDYLALRVTQAAVTYGPTSDLDPHNPFENLRFGDPMSTANGRVEVTIDIVRHQSVQTMILGIIPTASQQTVLVEHAGTISLALVPQPAPSWLPVGQLSSSAWLIDGVAIPPAGPIGTVAP